LADNVGNLKYYLQLLLRKLEFDPKTFMEKMINVRFPAIQKSHAFLFNQQLPNCENQLDNFTVDEAQVMKILNKVYEIFLMISPVTVREIYVADYVEYTAGYLLSLHKYASFIKNCF